MLNSYRQSEIWNNLLVVERDGCIRFCNYSACSICDFPVSRCIGSIESQSVKTVFYLKWIDHLDSNRSHTAHVRRLTIGVATHDCIYLFRKQFEFSTTITYTIKAFDDRTVSVLSHLYRTAFLRINLMRNYSIRFNVTTTCKEWNLLSSRSSSRIKL